MQEPYTLSGQKDISAEPLADIRHVSVNKDLSREERIAEFVRQIKDPYCFKCGKFTVRASFAQGGATLEGAEFAITSLNENPVVVDGTTYQRMKSS